jgi:hypothetical protein
VWASESVQNSILGEEVFELIGDIFPTIIRLELLDFSGEHIFSKEFEFNKTLVDINFVQNRIQPSESAIVIYEEYIVLATT